METTPFPPRAGLLAIVISICLLYPSSLVFSQVPVVTVRFANPTYNCATGQYCLDVEFLSDSVGVEVFGVNVRFFYDDEIMELDSFTDFQGGYGPVAPDPPAVTQSGPGIGFNLFGFGDPGTGVADFVNGAIQLVDDMQPSILLDTAQWMKLFKVCFTVDDPGMDSSSFCPPVVWDLEQNPANGGFLTGDDGVVITIVSADPMIMSEPSTENVVQFNWEYIGNGAPPYGQPVDSVCISLECIPTIVCPADVTIECDDSTDPLNTGIAMADTVCLADVTVSFSDTIIAGACAQAYIIERSWIATNACNIADTCLQLITVIDTTAPVIVFCPPDVTIECDQSPLPDNTGFASATDNCVLEPIVEYTDVTIAGICAQEYTIQRIWTASDSCGNSTTCLQVITVDDRTPPVITCLPDLTLQCTDTIPTDVATATDNCSELITYAYSDIVCDNPVMGFNGPYDFSLWTTILPPAGGSVTTMGDTEVMLVGPDDVTCSNAAVQFSIIIPSTGQLAFDWDYNTNDSDGPGFDPFGYNLNGTFFQLTVDNGPDIQSGKVSLTVMAGDVFAFEQQSSDCQFGEAATTVVEFFACVEQQAETCTQLVIRTHTATDECGNVGSCVQTFFIQDTLAPVLTCAPDITMECDASTLPDSTGLATATDNCDTTLIVEYSDITIGSQTCIQEYTILRTWTTMDACGNRASCTQTISVQDNTPPLITCPDNITIECLSSTSPDSTGIATASDVCDSLVSIDFVDVNTPGACPQEYTISRTWLAVDDCGNTSTCVQLISVQDTVPPVITCPDDITISVESGTSPDNTGFASATDNCQPGVPDITSMDVTIEGYCQGAYVIERTWTATDFCGNSATCLQIIRIDAECQIDLALIKTLNMGQDVIMPGDDVVFTITITNEGEVTAGEVHVIDYIPVGFALNDPDWTAGTDGSTGISASIILSVGNGLLTSPGLLPGESVDVEITLQAQPAIVPGIYENISEITSVFDSLGIDITDMDVDSDPDTDDTNDPDAEDDHDPALICVLIPPTVDGNRGPCPGDTVTYAIGDYNPLFTYTFMLDPAAGTIIMTTPSSVTIVWDDQPGGPYQLIITVSAGMGCELMSAIDIVLMGNEPIACFDHINLSIDNDCGTVILSGIILTGDQAGNNYYEVYIISMNGDTLPGDSLTWEHVGQTFKVSVVSLCNGQSCWGSVTVEDKLPPIIDCVCAPGDTSGNCTITCQQINAFLAEEIPDELRPVVIDSCGGTTLELTNVDLQYEPCSNGYVRVTWKATDAVGNMSTCNQEFIIVPLTLDSVQFPMDYPGDCDDSSHPDITGWPRANGMDLNEEAQLCNFYVYYTDQVVQLCGGGRKIIRVWTLLDWCTSESLGAIQTIWLNDRAGPVLTCTPDIQTGTSVWGCTADVIVPKPGAVDACSGITSYLLSTSAGQVVVQGNTYSIKGLPVGTHIATWTVKDACHNSSTCSFEITVVDNVPPVVSCHLHTVVSLTEERTNGVTLVYAESFNDGSFDNCGDISLRVRRMDSCIDFDWTTGGACVDDVPGGSPAVNGFDLGTEFGPCVPFACCDVGQDDIMVQLEVTDAAGNVNYCMVRVEVQDKIPVMLTCPEDIIVSCEFLFDIEEGVFSDALGNQDGTLDEDPLSEVFGNMYDAFRYPPSARGHIIIDDPNNTQDPQPYDWGLEGWAEDICPVNLQVEVIVTEDCSGAAFSGIVPHGAVKLIQRRFLGMNNGPSGSCLQRIWVVDFNPFYISDASCTNEDPLDGVIWPCDVLLTSCPDDIGDTGEPVILNDECSIIGVSYEDTRIDFADGACYKILREWKVLDWCQFDANTGYGLWTYTQTIKVADSEGVDFLDAPSGPVTYCLEDPGISLPANNQIFLGENNPGASSCSVHVDLALQVEELCSESVIYDVKIYPFNGLDFIQLVPETQVDLDANHQAEIRFNTEESSDPVIAANGLPYNDGSCNDYHRVLWSVEDGCGNRSYADYLFALWDCKDPTPVCIDGLSIMVMPPQGEVTIWASDFNASSYDDCTEGDSLLYSFNGESYQPSFTYTCDNVPEFGVEFDIEMWAADAGADLNCNGVIEWDERNKDFCVASLLITDVNDVCGNQGGILTGEVLTEFTDAVSPVTVNLSSPGIAIPSVVTAQNGQFTFDGIPMEEEYTLTPTRDDEHRNGVSTLDLVQIQKHLLGREEFSSPYQYIAADANNSQSVSAIDLVEIRKVILGLQEKFSNNTSWRFVRKGSPMAPGHPWPFTESIQIDHLTPENGTGMDFIGVKIGDVNNTVKANAAQVLPRSGRRLIPVKVNMVGTIKDGEEIAVELTFPEPVQGFQWTLETKGLEYMGIHSEDIGIGEQHVAVHPGGIITMSWNGEDTDTETGVPHMTVVLTFRVKEADRLIQMLEISDAITKAEAYSSRGEILDVELAFNSVDVLTEFALFQNKPNPWNHQTHIGFYLPQDAPATLSVYDAEGSVLKTVEGQYKAGYNTITLSRDEIPHTGLLYYRLESGTWSATKKMVTVE